MIAHSLWIGRKLPIIDDLLVGLYEKITYQ